MKTTNKRLPCLALFFFTAITGTAMAQLGWSVVQRGLNENVLQKTVVVNGTNQVHQIHIIASGLNYTNSSGQLAASSAQITIQPDGTAAGTQGQTTVKFPADIYNGVLRVTTPPPQSRNLYSRPLCVTYDDGSNTVVIAVLTNSIGCLTASNQVTYPNCFVGNDGRPIGDLVCDYKLSGFECSLVFRAQPPDPSQFGLDASFCTLQLVTEFFSTQDPQQIPAGSDDWFGLQDSTLKFGGLTMTRGKAFAFGNSNTNSPAVPKLGGTSVYKNWIHTDDGRTFLVEHVPVAYVADSLAALPLTASIQKPSSKSKTLLAAKVGNTGLESPVNPQGRTSASQGKPVPRDKPATNIRRFASKHPVFPSGHGIMADTNQILLAAADFRQKPGFVLDYVEQLEDSRDDITITPGTWFVAGPVYYAGTVTIQGGAIFKYPNDTTASIEIAGSITCPATTDPPAYFTAGDCDSLGESLNGIWSGYTGTIRTTEDPYLESYYGQPEYGYAYGAPALILDGACNLNNLRFNYAMAVVSIPDGSGSAYNFANLQINWCDTTVGLDLNGPYDGGNSFSFDNCLWANEPLMVNDPTEDSWSFINCTFDDTTLLGDQDGSSNPPQFGYMQTEWGMNGGILYESPTFVNCIFSDVLGDSSGFFGSNNGFFNGSLTSLNEFNWNWLNPFGDNQIAASSFPFTTAAWANYYLAANCPFHNAGTVNIDPNLLAQLQTMTTYAPQDGGHVDTSGTDLGYHYPINEDSDNDGIPDWWIWKYFNSYAFNGTNIDAYGNTLLYDYQNQQDPNVIQFSVTATNNYVNTGTPKVQVNVTAGIPLYYAVLVDSTSFATASWSAFTSSNLTIGLGANEGWHNVWIGLKGSPASSSQVWECRRLKLELTLPQLVITGPASPTVNVPEIQLTGYCPEKLLSIRYDLANAAGVVTNQPVLVLSQCYDTNAFEFTTNSFQAFDVPLANGVNTITLHATDLAGNVTTLVTNITVDYSNKTAPVAQLTWPQDGMSVCGNSMTLHGQVDDPTVMVTATVTDQYANSSTVWGLVERDGRFWVENLPLNAGNNAVSITLNNVMNQSTVINLTLVQSPLTLTLNPVGDDSQLWLPTLSVGGTVSDATDVIWVNGVVGVNNGDGTWSANNVPVTPGGVAIFEVTAYPPSEAPDPGLSGTGVNPLTANAQNIDPNVDKPPRLYVQKYQESDMLNLDGIYKYVYDAQENLIESYNGHDDFNSSINWQEQTKGGASGTEKQDQITTITGLDPNIQFEEDTSDTWGTDTWPYTTPGKETINDTWTDQGQPGSSQLIYDPDAPLIPSTTIVNKQPKPGYYYRAITLEHNDVGGTQTGSADTIMYDTYDNVIGDVKTGEAISYFRKGDAMVWLSTGGKSASGRQSLFMLHADLTKYSDPLFNYFWIENEMSYNPVYLPYGGVVYSAPIFISNLGQLDNDGNLWVALLDGTTVDVTPYVNGVNYYTFNEPTPPKYTPQIVVNGSNPLWPDHVASYNIYCVGQYLSFDLHWSPGTPGFNGAVAIWNLPGTFVNTNPYPYCPAYYDENDAFLTKSLEVDGTLSTYCWYVNDFQDESAVAMLTLFFPNGQIVDMNVDGAFSVVKPTIDRFVVSSLQTFFHTNFPNEDPVRVGAVIDWKTFAKPPANFSGNAFYVQFVERNWSYGSQVPIFGCEQEYDTESANAYWLDLTYPYNDPGTPVLISWNDNPEKSIPHSDSPELSGNLCSSLSLSDKFKTYLQFQPNTSGSIPVTIGRIDWSWSCTASESGGIWTWSLGSSGPTPDWNDTTFPYWTPSTIYHGN